MDRLRVGRDLLLHEPDDVADVGVDGHGHVVGHIVGDAFGCSKKINF